MPPRRKPLTLVSGGADGLRGLLVDWGYEQPQAAVLADTVELYAARTLLDERPRLPAGFAGQAIRLRA